MFVAIRRGVGIAATLSLRSGIAVDPFTELFLDDLGGNRLRQVNAAGILTTWPSGLGKERPVDPRPRGPTEPGRGRVTRAGILKWTPNTGPLDRGVSVKALPHFNRGSGRDSRPNGPSTSGIRHAGAECASAIAVGRRTWDIPNWTRHTLSETESEVGLIISGEGGPLGGKPSAVGIRALRERVGRHGQV
jgi:hypothetical protein